MGFLKDLVKGKSSSTYQAPNIDFLRESAPSVNYDFLKAAADSAGGLAGKGKTYQDFLRTTTPNASTYFSDYVGSIKAPSSVDAVQSELNNEKLTNTLAGIERDTKQRFGSSIMDSYLRGLTGGGAASDIAGNAAAQVLAGGQRAAADARTALYQSELDKMAEREKALQTAYGQRYQAGEQGDLTREQLNAGLAESAAAAYNQLLATGAGQQGSLLSSYASGLQSEADREMGRRTALANALLGIASSQASNTTRSPGLLDSFASGLNQGVSSLTSKGVQELPQLFL